MSYQQGTYSLFFTENPVTWN